MEAQEPETSPGNGVFPEVTSAEAIVIGKSGRPDFESYEAWRKETREANKYRMKSGALYQMGCGESNLRKVLKSSNEVQEAIRAAHTMGDTSGETSHWITFGSTGGRGA